MTFDLVILAAAIFLWLLIIGGAVLAGYLSAADHIPAEQRGEVLAEAQRRSP